MDRIDVVLKKCFMFVGCSRMLLGQCCICMEYEGKGFREEVVLIEVWSMVRGSLTWKCDGERSKKKISLKKKKKSVVRGRGFINMEM